MTLRQIHKILGEVFESDVSRRVPIATLLRQDTASVVDRFSEQGRTYYKFKNDMYLFPADDVRRIPPAAWRDVY